MHTPQADHTEEVFDVVTPSELRVAENDGAKRKVAQLGSMPKFWVSLLHFPSHLLWRLEIKAPWRQFSALPARMIGDRAYDSDRLDRDLAERYGIEMIAPHRGVRRKPTQDGRPLRRYCRRWRKYLSKSPVNAMNAAIDDLYLGGFFRFILHQRQELEGIANVMICEFMGTIFLVSVSEPAALVQINNRSCD